MKNEVAVMVAMLLTAACTHSDGNAYFTDEQIATVKVSEASVAKVGTEGMQVVDCNKIVESEYYYFSSMLDTMFFVTLDDSKQESLVGQIKELVVNDSLIYIMDDTNAYNVVVFGRDGRFVNRMKIGQGPGEITYLLDLDVDPSNGDLLLYQNRGLSRYTSGGLQYKGSQTVPLGFEQFMVTDSGYVFYQRLSVINDHIGVHKDKSILVTDRDFKLQESAVDMFNMPLGKQNKCLFRMGEELRVVVPFNDTVYGIGDYGVRAVCQVEFRNKKIPTKELFESKIPAKTISESEDKYAFMGDYLETPTHQKIALYNRHPVTIYVDKTTGNATGAPVRLFNPTIAPDVPEPIWSSGDYFISVCPPTFKDLDLVKPGVMSAEDIAKLKLLKEDSNPVLCFFKLKHF